MKTEVSNLVDEFKVKKSEYKVYYDLKVYLITIKGFLGFLIKDIEKKDSRRVIKDIKRMNLASDKMKSLLDDLLESSWEQHKSE